MKDILFIREFFIEEFGDEGKTKITGIGKLLNNIEYQDELA
jgi:hypothetical protein